MPDPVLSKVGPKQLIVRVHSYRHDPVYEPQQQHGDQHAPRGQAHGGEALHSQEVPAATWGSYVY